GGPGRGRRPGPLYLRRQPPKTPLLPYTTLFRSGRTPTRGRFVGGEIAAFGLAPADFRQRFAAQQRGALRKAICQQLAVVIGPAVVGVATHDEIDWRAVAALMQPLEEGVLGIGPRHPPHGRAGGQFDRIAVTVDR